ncbi:MAG: LytTR family DNA-binding domain-containing protein [Dokdonella sp.]|uniref:LytR/AlgR family response regulator transcription factor n=1 Tax=Dokdonella sp. TaxID=2291710 RepID=UPI003BAF14A4
MNRRSPTALIADDEPLLRDSLARMLRQAWPELEVVAMARNGREAVEQFEALAPAVCFLDVHMPGMSGVEAARCIGRRAELVFVTAFDNYALQAFEQGVLDYLVKPVESARLDATVARIRERLLASNTTSDNVALIEQLAARLRTGQSNALRWIRASVGTTVRLIAVDEIDYLRSDGKYTRVAWRNPVDKCNDALIRMPLREILDQLDPAQFIQIHRAVVVNLRAVSHVVRADNETASLHLRGRDEVLPVSRSYLHLFKQM